MIGSLHPATAMATHKILINFYGLLPLFISCTSWPLENQDKLFILHPHHVVLLQLTFHQLVHIDLFSLMSQSSFCKYLLSIYFVSDTI